MTLIETLFWLIDEKTNKKIISRNILLKELRDKRDVILYIVKKGLYFRDKKRKYYGSK